MKTYRVLLLGAGFWGSRWLRFIEKCERTQLAGVACDAANGKRIIEQDGIAPELVYDDFRAAIASVDADIMVNVLPAALHFEADCLAIDRGMHIIAEKPLVASMDEAKRLVKAFSAHPSLRFMASQNYRWRPHNMAIKAALRDGMIGDLEFISLNFRQQEDLQGYRGGLEMPLVDDMSIHHFDLLRYFSGSDCEEIVARTWRPSWSLYPGEPNLDAVLRMKNGVRVAYTGTWAARGRETSWDGDIMLCGSKGCLTLEVDNRVRFFSHQRADAVILDTQRQSGALLQNPEMEYTETEYGLRRFIDTLDRGDIPETNLEDNFKSFAMVMACKQAARDKLPANVEPLGME